MNTVAAPVGIVGAGPVGLISALRLAGFGPWSSFGGAGVPGPGRRGQAPKGTGGMPRRHQECRRGRLRNVRGSCPTSVEPGIPESDPGN